MYGITWGITPWTTTWIGLAPVAVSASTGPQSVASIASEKSLEIRPTLNVATASTPGKGPIPTTMTHMIPQKRVGIDRMTAIRKRTAK